MLFLDMVIPLSTIILHLWRVRALRYILDLKN